MQSLDNHVSTYPLHPNLSHKPLLHHVDQGQGAKKQDPHASLSTPTQNGTHVLPKPCTTNHFNQALHPYLHYTTSTLSLNPSIDPSKDYAIKLKEIDDDKWSFRSCSYGLKDKAEDTKMGLNSSIQEEKRTWANSCKIDTNMDLNSGTLQEEKRRANSYEELLSQSLEYPNNTCIKKIDRKVSFTSCSYGVVKVKEEGMNSSNDIQEEKVKREKCYDKKKDQELLSSQVSMATPTQHDTSSYSPLCNPKLEVSMESLVSSANPNRASTCKFSKSPTRKKKAHQKQIMCVPMASGNKSPGECLHSDSWAWRKYGQKPIKGSPYPRGYYRCSSCKGCTARKQVERNRSDPSMLVITYTSEHNHTWQANQNNPQKTLNENPTHPHQIPNSIDSSTQHADNIHVTLSIDSPCTTTLKGNSPCMDDTKNLQDERSQNELDLFGLLEELPINSSLMMFESAKSPLSEQEDPIAIVHSNIVDPFNLFNWSSTIGLNYYSAT